MCRLRVFVLGRWWSSIWGHEQFFILLSAPFSSKCSVNGLVLQGSLVRVMVS